MRIAEEKQEVCCEYNMSCFDVPLCRQVGDSFNISCISTWNPKTTIYKWLFQLDDSKSLCRKMDWKSPVPSIYKWFFGVSGIDQM